MSQHNKYYMSDRIDVSNKKENRIIENNESNTYNTCFIIKLYCQFSIKFDIDFN